jgi:hypothetical protein
MTELIDSGRDPPHFTPEECADITQDDDFLLDIFGMRS